MAEWWATLSVAMKVLWGVTLAASLIFIIQSVMTFIGADADSTGLDGGLDAGSDFGGMHSADGALDASADGGDGSITGGSNLYTFRNLINFLLGFGWSVILLRDSIKPTAILIFVAALIGLGLVAAVMYMFRLLSKMQQSGTINVYTQAVGCQGSTYLKIPGNRSGEGKVQITINGAVREYDAQTEGDTIPTGTPIKVVEVINEGTLLVETLASEII